MKILSILRVFLNALSEDGVLNSGSYPAKVIGKFSGHFLPSICNRRNPASWNSSSLDFTPLYFKPVLRGKYCGHHTRPPYILRGQKFSLSVIFENLGAKPAHPRLSLLFYFSHGLHQYGGQEFSLTTSSFLSFSKISVQNQLIFAFLFPFCSVSSTIL